LARVSCVGLRGSLARGMSIFRLSLRGVVGVGGRASIPARALAVLPPFLHVRLEGNPGIFVQPTKPQIKKKRPTTTQDRKIHEATPR
jgi:hypothetical protein